MSLSDRDLLADYNKDESNSGGTIAASAGRAVFPDGSLIPADPVNGITQPASHVKYCK